MIHIVEYKLHAGQVPYFIKDGGYFHNSCKFIGVTHCDENCFIPPSSELETFATKQDLINNIVLKEFISSEGALSEQTKEDLASSFWDEKNV